MNGVDGKVKQFAPDQRLWFISALVIIVLCGCRPKAQIVEAHPKEIERSNLQRDRAVAAAKEEVIKALNWGNNIEVAGATFEDGRWTIQLWKLPKMPGGFATVEVSLEGKATIARMPR